MRRGLPKDWRSRMEWKYERGRHSFEFVIRFKANRKLKRFKREVGRLSVDDKSPYFVSNVFVDEYFRGLGLGFGLYERAIAKLGKLSTKYYKASDEAQGIWKKLSGVYRSRRNFFTGTLTVYKSKNT